MMYISSSDKIKGLLYLLDYYSKIKSKGDEGKKSDPQYFAAQEVKSEVPDEIWQILCQKGAAEAVIAYYSKFDNADKLKIISEFDLENTIKKTEDLKPSDILMNVLPDDDSDKDLHKAVCKLDKEECRSPIVIPTDASGKISLGGAEPISNAGFADKIPRGIGADVYINGELVGSKSFSLALHPFLKGSVNPGEGGENGRDKKNGALFIGMGISSALTLTQYFSPFVSGAYGYKHSAFHLPTEHFPNLNDHLVDAKAGFETEFGDETNHLKLRPWAGYKKSWLTHNQTPQFDYTVSPSFEGESKLRYYGLDAELRLDPFYLGVNFEKTYDGQTDRPGTPSSSPLNPLKIGGRIGLYPFYAFFDYTRKEISDYFTEENYFQGLEFIPLRNINMRLAYDRWEKTSDYNQLNGVKFSIGMGNWAVEGTMFRYFEEGNSDTIYGGYLGLDIARIIDLVKQDEACKCKRQPRANLPQEYLEVDGINTKDYLAECKEINCLYEAFKRYGFSIDKDSRNEAFQYEARKSADLNNDGHIRFNEYLEYLEKSGAPAKVEFSKAQKLVAEHLAFNDNTELVGLIDKYGLAAIVSYVEESEKIKENEGKDLISSLKTLAYLINSKEDLDYVAKKLVHYIKKNAEGACFQHGIYDTLQAIKGMIKTKEDIDIRINEFLELRKKDSKWGEGRFCEAVYGLSAEFHNRYGLQPFISIGRKSGNKAIVEIFNEPVKALINRYGIEFFVQLSDRTERFAFRIFKSLPKLSKLIDQYGTKVFLDIAEKAGSYTGAVMSALIIVADSIYSKDDLVMYSNKFLLIARNVGEFGEDGLLDDSCLDSLSSVSDYIKLYGLDSFVDFSKKADKSTWSTFLNKLSEYKDIISSSDDLLFVGNKLIEYAKKFGESSSFEYLNTVPQLMPMISNREDLNFVCQKLYEYSMKFKEDSRETFLSLVARLEHIISNKNDLGFVCEKLFNIYKEFPENFSTIAPQINKETVTDKEDLEKGPLYLLKKTDAAKVGSDRSFNGLFDCIDAFLALGDCSSAYDFMQELERRANKPGIVFWSPGDGEIAKYKLKIIAQILLQSNGATWTYLWKEKAMKYLEEICEKSKDSPEAQAAIMLKEALSPMGNDFTVRKSQYDGFKIIKINKISGLSLVVFNKDLSLEVIPGDAVVIGDEVHVTKYRGKFKVVYGKPKETIPENNSALLQAYQTLPTGFFEGFKILTFTGTEHENIGGDYNDYNNEVRVNKNGGALGTIVHELCGHHWDMAVAVGNDGNDRSFGDLSLIYYGISWDTQEKIKLEIEGRDYDKVPMKRDDFDKEEFAYNYGLCNRREDFATMADWYVTTASSLRSSINTQMKKGKFGKAAKYLFVRYLTPFHGREYNVASDSVGFEEVKKAIEVWQKEHPGTIKPHILDAIKKIEEKYKELQYK